MVPTSSNNDYLLYDGECPFCTAYVKMQRLREAGVNLSILDARSNPQLVAEELRQGRDVNEGMILRIGDATYFGGDVMFQLSLMSGNSSGINRLFVRVFSNQKMARTLYPLLKFGRGLLLFILGRKKIDVIK